MKKLGLIAGNGELPMAVAAEAREKGYLVFAAALEPLADPSLSGCVNEFRWINVGKLGSLIDYLKKSGVSEAVMAGKVPKSLLYKSRIVPDMRAVKLLFSLKDRSDDTIMLAITKELQGEGITLLNTTDFTENLLVTEGVLTKKKPSKEQLNDIEFGWEIAREIGRLDIGQTIVVKDRAVMAIEAIEGTDEAIRRGAKLGGEGSVVIKLSKPQQDLRFDVPVIGMQTLRTMQECRAGVLAVEAGKSIMLQKNEMIAAADKSGIPIVGISPRQDV